MIFETINSPKTFWNPYKKNNFENNLIKLGSLEILFTMEEQRHRGK